MLNNIDLNSIVSILGPPLKKIGSEYMWQCPYCVDKSKNNLMYNSKKNLLFCFADSNHSRLLLKDIWQSLKKKGEKPKFNKTKKAEIIQEISLSLIQIEKFKTYCYKCNKELLSCKKSLNILQDKRGITKETVRDCFIGVDKSKNRFVFPSVKYASRDEVIGFEYRPLNLSKKSLYREKCTPTGMVQINSHTSLTSILIIVEGYLDGYVLYQHLKKLKQHEFYHIITPSNGVTSALKHIEAVVPSFNKYKHTYAFLDSDGPGKDCMAKLQLKYPQIKPFIMTCGCKDFNEHYLKCLKGRIP